MQPDSPSSILEFQQRFATEEACEAYLFAWRWPHGFACPRCDGRTFARLSRRSLYQCGRCHHQASVTAGTALHKSKLPLRVWFWAIFLVARDKKGISALQLQRELGLGSYRSAWLLLQKIRRCFGESEAYPLRGFVEVDETYVDGVERGAQNGRGRGRKKSLVVAAVEVTPKGLGALRLRAIPSPTRHELLSFVGKSVQTGSTVATDGWNGYYYLDLLGFRRKVHVEKYGLPPSALRGVHLVISNLKTWLQGRYHGSVRPKYLPAYLDEFAYRFNRRFSPPRIFGWVARRLATRLPRTLREIQAEIAA